MQAAERVGAIPACRVQRLGLVPYEPTLKAMREFTLARSAETPDELWFLEHPSVYTQGQAGRAEHVLAPGDIPVVQSDRGGQVTYHGPGQLVVYVLADLGRLGYGTRSLVTRIESAMVETLAGYGVTGVPRRDAPGVYVDVPAPLTEPLPSTRGEGRTSGLRPQPSSIQKKIGSLGLRIRAGRSYHGLSLNVAMDLAPFARINPCGYAGLQMTQLAELGGPADVAQVGRDLEPRLRQQLGLR